MLIDYLESWDSIYLSRHIKGHLGVEEKSLKIDELEMHLRVNAQKSNASISGWIANGNLFLYPSGYMSAVKENEIMKFIGKWIELEIIICCEITKVQKDKAVCSFSHEDVGSETSDTHV